MSENLTLEEMIMKGLVEKPDFSAKVSAYIKADFFDDHKIAHIVKTFKSYQAKYGNTPSWDAILIDGNADTGSLREEGVKEFNTLVNRLKKEPTPSVDTKWLFDETEKYCRNQSLFSAIATAVSIYKGQNVKYDRGAIPGIMQDALALSFNTSIGHDYIDDAMSRWNNMHAKAAKLPFDIETLNNITGGGAESQTLNMILAGTHVGKTLMLCHLTAAYLSAGYDVLYVTLEMAQEKIANRIDCNLLDIPITQLGMTNKNAFMSKVQSIKNKTTGRLIIKEFPTTGCTIDHLKALLNELQLKKGIKPKVLIVDYINLMASSRLKATENTYIYVKAVSEELRGLAVQENLCVWSATQTNRQGSTATDFDMTATSESFGLPMTVDFMIGAIRTEELDKQNQVLIKQLKSRYGDTTAKPKFFLGMDRAKFRLYETTAMQNQSTNIGHSDDQEDKPVMDSTEFGSRESETRRSGFLGRRRDIGNRIEIKRRD